MKKWMKDKSEFDSFRDVKKKIHARTFIAFSQEAGEDFVLGIITSAKVGGAVYRNNIRRVVKEIYRNYNFKSTKKVLLIFKRGLDKKYSNKEIKQIVASDLADFFSKY